MSNGADLVALNLVSNYGELLLNFDLSVYSAKRP